MKSDKDNIKDIFSSKLKGFEPELPPSLWEKIDSDLSARQIQGAPSAGRIKWYKLSVWAGAAAAVFAAIMLLYPDDQMGEAIAMRDILNADRAAIISLLQEKMSDRKLNDNQSVDEFGTKRQSNVFITSAGNRHSYTGTRPISPYFTEIIEERIGDNLESKHNLGVADDSVASNFNKQEEYFAEDANISENREQEHDIEFEKELAEKIAAFEAAGKEVGNLLVDNSTPDKNITKNRTGGSADNGFALGVEGGGAFSKASDVQNQLRVANMDDLEANNNQIYSTFRNQRMKLNHNQPINFGVNVSKKLTNRLAIETGIVYTYLSSKIKSTEKSDYTLRDSRQFHYLGVPVSFTYQFLECNKLQFYGSLGAMIQKDFYGRMRSNENIDDPLNMENYKKTNISQEHPQFSATASLGLSYPLYKKMAIYTNLGSSYYFDAKNEYETIYSDRKWIFNISLGVRFGF